LPTALPTDRATTFAPFHRVLDENPDPDIGAAVRGRKLDYAIDDKCDCSADNFLRGGEKKCSDGKKCGRNSATKDKPFCVSAGHGCNNDVMTRCQAGDVGDYCDDDSCVPHSRSAAAHPPSNPPRSPVVRRSCLDGNSCSKFAPTSAVECSSGTVSAAPDTLTAEQQAEVEAGLKNGVVNLGLKLNFGDQCTPGNESTTCSVRL